VVLNADEFGVWVSGWAPIADRQGKCVGLVCADSPAQGQVAAGHPGDSSGFVASLLGEAGKRLVLAEFDAATDGVTGLYNHRFLQERLAEEVSRAEHSGATVAVLFLDIDHFKSFNDEWGHSLGDAVLRLVARVVEAEVRRSDVVARYGGEEFAAILPGAELVTAWGVAERIRRKIARSPIMAGMRPVTVSVGVAVYPSDGMTLAELIDRADSAMYQAKRLGRDRVHAWTPTGQVRRPRSAATRPRRK
jgi:diguanylate cyclase (GGDEF)-like protein